MLRELKFKSSCTKLSIKLIKRFVLRYTSCNHKKSKLSATTKKETNALAC